MRRTTVRMLIVVLAIGMIAVALSADMPSWSCGVSTQVRNAVYGKGERVGLSWATQTKGFSLIGTSSGVKGLYANLHGIGQLRFKYSPNITHVQVFVRNERVYSGSPIESVVGRGAVHIQPQWTGDAFEIEVTDNCSLRSIFSGHFG